MRLNEQSKSTVVNVVAVVMFMLGGFLRGAFDDRWFGDLLGYSVSGIAILLWSHKGKWFWPEEGVQKWEEFRTTGFLRYMVRWVLLGLGLTLILAPIFYVLHLLFDNPSRTTPLLNYMKVSLIMGLALGVLTGIWAWLDCELIYRATRSKPSTGTATEP